MKSKSGLKTISFIVVFITSFLLMCNSPNTKSSFRGDNLHSGVYENTEIKNPTLKWKCNLNGRIYSSPTIFNNTAYIGSSDNNLYAIDIKKGSVKWKYKSNGAIHSTPAVNDRLVFFMSFDGNFYAVDRKTGKKIWSFKTEGEKQFSAKGLFGHNEEIEYSDPWDFYLSSPVIEDDIVYFGSGDNNIYALNVNSGELIWKYKTKNVVHSSPAISNGIVYCGSFDSKLHALDAKTGKLIWSFQAGNEENHYFTCGIQSSPSVLNNVVYFGSRDTHVYALNAVTGNLIWKQKFGGSWMPSSTAVTENRVYVGSSDAKLCFSLNKETGEIIDSLRTGSFTFSSPVVSGNTVFVGVFNGLLMAFDKNNGKAKWSFPTDASKSSKDKYFTSEGIQTDELYAGLSFKKYNEMQILLDRVYSVGAIISSPVINKGTLYFSSTDGYLYAIN